MWLCVPFSSRLLHHLLLRLLDFIPYYVAHGVYYLPIACSGVDTHDTYVCRITTTLWIARQLIILPLHSFRTVTLPTRASRR